MAQIPLDKVLDRALLVLNNVQNAAAGLDAGTVEDLKRDIAAIKASGGAGPSTFPGLENPDGSMDIELNGRKWRFGADGKLTTS